MDKKIYEELINTALNGISYDKLVDKCAKVLGNPLVIIDNSFNIIMHSKNLLSTDIIWLEAVNRGYITIEFGATLTNWDLLYDPSLGYIDIFEISDKTRRFMKLTFEGQTYGYLNITEEFHSLNDIDVNDYRLIASLLAKELLFDYKVLELKDFSTKEEDIIIELLNERFIDRVHFLSRTKNVFNNEYHNFSVGFIDLDHFISYNAHHSLILENINNCIPNSLIVVYDKGLVVLNRGGDINIEKLKTFLKDYELIMGVSDHFSDIYNIKTYYLQAKAALRLRFLNNEDTLYHYANIRQYHLFESFSNDELINFCDKKILKLKHNDDLYKTEYVKTVKYYLIYQKSIQKIADILYVHRNTINYRISKIKELLNIDIEEDQLDPRLLMSCEIIEFINYRSLNNH